jgi:hypothetical protein
LYTRAQRLGLLQFTLFNWIISEKRNRYFPRRTQATNLWFEVGDPPSYRLDEVVLPANAAKAQVFDLIPGAAYHGEQLASRCHRPESAVGAAAANKLHREAELLK